MSVWNQGKAVRRLLAVLLAMALLCSAAVVPVMAEEAEGEQGEVLSMTAEPESEGGEQGEEEPEQAPEEPEDTTPVDPAADAVPYDDYLAKFPTAKPAAKEIVLHVADEGVYDISKMEGAAVITAANDEGGVMDAAHDKALLLPESGTVTFTFEVAEAGLYSLRAEYNGYNEEVSKESSIERRLLIDGVVPYNEAEYVSLSRKFRDVYRLDENGERLHDVNGNDIRPGQEEVFDWLVQDVYDVEGYCKKPLQFYFTPGTHTIGLESQREAVLLYSITLFGLTDVPSYAEVKASYGNKGYKPANGEITYIQAENSVFKSEKSNYPLADRSSAATQPQDAFCTLLNYIGGEKWQNNGSWVEWQTEVKESGLYKIALRFRQDIYSGVKVSRKLTINGEVPFAEAEALTFDYKNAWDVVTLGNEEEDYYFYFEAGQTYTLRMQVVLGEMGDLLNRVTSVLTALNADYRTILMITGSSPDKYRSYGFDELIPDTLDDMKKQAEEIEAIVDEMIALTGETGERTATLTKLAVVLRQMTDKPIVIAAKFSMFKDDISSLGTWILESAYQPMKLDYIALVPDNQKTPKAGAGFFKELAYGFRFFISSFVIDYQSVGTTTTNENTTSNITVWVTTGRDQSNIIRNLIDTSFTPEYNIGVNLQLVSGAAVLPCVLAGKGPDVCVGVASGDPVNYAIRDAVYALNDFDGFDQTLERFHPSALVHYTFNGKTYALPETQSFCMMFVRTDIFNELGLSIPKTWEDLELLIPELQKRNMAIGLGHDLNALLMFMYQRGEPLYLPDENGVEGATANLDSSTAVRSFTQLCEYFTLYGFPTDFNAANRFRSGEMPLLIADYGLYNELSLFAPEIRGDWAMCQIPGTEQADGTINQAETSGGAAVAMFRGCKDQDAAWQFMQWWTSADTMLRYGNEMETAMNGSARQAVANMEALSNMSWTITDLDNILEQWEHIVGTPEVPGSYYTGRVLGFAFSEAYNNSTDPGDALQQYIESLNAELTRKRSEFGL